MTNKSSEKKGGTNLKKKKRKIARRYVDGGGKVFNPRVDPEEKYNLLGRGEAFGRRRRETNLTKKKAKKRGEKGKLLPREAPLPFQERKSRNNHTGLLGRLFPKRGAH